MSASSSQADSNEQTSNARGVRAVLSTVDKKILGGEIVVYRNVLNHPYVTFDVRDYPKGNFDLTHDDVAAWLFHFAWSEVGHNLSASETKQILAYLRSRSLERKSSAIGDPGILQLLQTEPTFAVVYEYMVARRGQKYETEMDVLHKELLNWAKQHDLLRVGKKRFPGGPQVLSRKLTWLADAFGAVEIHLKIWRSNGSKIMIQGPVDASAPEPSAEPSALNSLSDAEKEPEDDKTSQLARLRQKKEEKRMN